jgi:glycine/serine hydroxymethyltransferase
MESVKALEQQVQALAKKTVANNLWRQRQSVNLIPSENTPSLLVKLMEISDPAGRYAEHRTMKGEEIYFYQGIDFIREVEEQARAEVTKYFGCSDAELRTVSGQMANEVVFKGMAKFVNRNAPAGTPFRRLRAVMNNDLNLGGHLSSQPMGALFNYVDVDPQTNKETVINFPVCKDNPYRIDIKLIPELLERHKPELIVFGKSMFIYPEPVAEVAAMVKEMSPRPVIMYDMAHVLGLYGAFQKPFEDGADIVTGSTHKTYFGPQRGLIVANLPKGSALRPLWIEIKNRAFPGSTSNHHLGTLLGLLMATLEMNAFKEPYQNQVRNNARAFAKALAKCGLDVQGDPQDGYTHTHQVLIRVSKHGDGAAIARRLEDNSIVVNYQALPGDESFLASSGLRTGAQEMTRFGMVEKDFERLAELFAEVVLHNKSVKDEVARFRSNFVDMRYCLPAESSLGLAAEILSSVFPSNEKAKAFADKLVQVAARI